MSNIARRPSAGLTVGRFGSLDRMFDEWMRSFPMARSIGIDWDWTGEDVIRVDQYRDGDTEVIRAELPGIDPEKDVEITVLDGLLHVRAERASRRSRRTRGTAATRSTTAP